MYSFQLLPQHFTIGDGWIFLSGYSEDVTFCRMKCHLPFSTHFVSSVRSSWSLLPSSVVFTGLHKSESSAKRRNVDVLEIDFSVSLICILRNARSYRLVTALIPINTDSLMSLS